MLRTESAKLMIVCAVIIAEESAMGVLYPDATQTYPRIWSPVSKKLVIVSSSFWYLAALFHSHVMSSCLIWMSAIEHERSFRGRSGVIVSTRPHRPPSSPPASCAGQALAWICQPWWYLQHCEMTSVAGSCLVPWGSVVFAEGAGLTPADQTGHPPELVSRISHEFSRRGRST